MESFLRSIRGHTNLPKIQGQFIDLLDNDMPVSYVDFITGFGDKGIFASGKFPATVDEFNQTFPETAEKVDRDAMDLISRGEIAKAFVLVDSAKSTFYHSEVNRRTSITAAFMSQFADFQKKHYGSEIGANTYGFTSMETVLGFVKAEPSKIMLSYYTTSDQLVAFMLGRRKGKPYICAFTDTEGLETLSELHSRYASIISTEKWGIYDYRRDELNKLLLALSSFNGAVLKIALDQFDNPKSLLISPYSFLHALPLHIGKVQSRDTLRIFTAGITYTPSLGILASKTTAHAADGSFGAGYRFVIDERNLQTGSAEKEFLQVLLAHSKKKVEFSQPTRSLLEDEELKDLLILHFSCHGTSSATKWEDSNLEMQDGCITAKEILNRVELKRAWIVVLSACETGLLLDLDAKIDRYTGLDMAFWVSGANGVVSTFWSVQEPSAFVFNMLFYHAAFYEGQPPPKAYVLATACLRDGAWKTIIQDRVNAMRSGLWPAESCVHLKPLLEEILKMPTNRFSDMVYWAPFKYLGF
jgi:hypothetical protein